MAASALARSPASSQWYASSAALATGRHARQPGARANPARGPAHTARAAVRALRAGGPRGSAPAAARGGNHVCIRRTAGPYEEMPVDDLAQGALHVLRGWSRTAPRSRSSIRRPAADAARRTDWPDGDTDASRASMTSRRRAGRSSDPVSRRAATTCSAKNGLPPVRAKVRSTNPASGAPPSACSMSSRSASRSSRGRSIRSTRAWRSSSARSTPSPSAQLVVARRRHDQTRSWCRFRTR